MLETAGLVQLWWKFIGDSGDVKCYVKLKDDFKIVVMSHKTGVSAQSLLYVKQKTIKF